MSNSNSRRSGGQPKLPSKDFPLRIHKGSGYWCKKVQGRVYYFGKIADDPKGQAALGEWLRVKDDLLAGREPRANTDGLTVAELCNQFLAHKEGLRNNGEITPRTFRGHYDSCESLVKQIGRNRLVVDLVPADFRKLRTTLAKRLGAVSLRGEMQRIRGVFKFAFDDGLILAPMRYGQGFAKPGLDTVRRERGQHKAKHGLRMFEAQEIRLILTNVKQPMRAMVLLAANTGFGATDLARLPMRAVDLDNGWLDFARPKTGVDRRIPLWPETVAAIREWLPLRPKAFDKADNGILFLTRRGTLWVCPSFKTGVTKDTLGLKFTKILIKLGLKRPRLGFYGLRHGFETIAGETTDQVAVDAVMGHVAQGMAATYRERIGDDRLKRVTDHVRQWLFGNTDDDTTAKKPETPDTTSQQTEDVDDNEGPRLRLFAG